MSFCPTLVGASSCSRTCAYCGLCSIVERHSASTDASSAVYMGLCLARPLRRSEPEGSSVNSGQHFIWLVPDRVAQLPSSKEACMHIFFNL